MHPALFNFAADVIDRQAAQADKEALVWCDAAGAEKRYLYSEIADRSARLASSLARLGVGKGDRVIIMLPRIPQWQIATVACLRLGAVVVPCIEMLTAKDIDYRVRKAGAKAVITTTAQTGKFAGLADVAPVRIAFAGAGGGAEGWLDFVDLVRAGDPGFPAARVAADDPAILYFTSGSTGQPKGVLHAARGLWHWRKSAFDWLDLKPQDLIWCTADTGWSKAGTSILFGPWSCGSAVLFHDGPFDPRRRLELIEKYRVTVFCAAGTEILRLLDQPIDRFDLSALRRTVSAGEAVPEPAAQGWLAATGLTIAEAYGQTETLMSLGHLPGTPRKPQSMGVPLAHCELSVIDESGAPLGDGEVGELAIRAPNPQFMLGYWQDPERTAACYVENAGGLWFRTGDRALRDADGHYFHRGRNDDVINSSGYRIGPAEVEDVLLTHAAVAEAGVVGAPDPHRGEIVVACVVLRPGHAASGELARALQDHVKAQTAPYKYPRAVRFIDAMPKTLTGKVQRNVLREQVAALAAGGTLSHHD